MSRPAAAGSHSDEPGPDVEDAEPLLGPGKWEAIGAEWPLKSRALAWAKRLVAVSFVVAVAATLVGLATYEGHHGGARQATRGAGGYEDLISADFPMTGALQRPKSAAHRGAVTWHVHGFLCREERLPPVGTYDAGPGPPLEVLVLAHNLVDRDLLNESYFLQFDLMGLQECADPAISTLRRARAQSHDAVIMVGDFKASSYSQTVLGVAQWLHPALNGSTSTYEHVLTNLGPACARRVVTHGNHTRATWLELGGACGQPDVAAVGKSWEAVAPEAQNWALAGHSEAGPAAPAPPPPSTDAPRLAAIDMRWWNCRMACFGGGCCSEGDCTWVCTEDRRYKGSCGYSRWTGATYTCELFAAGPAQLGRGAPATPASPGEAPLISFYAYRAQSDDMYELDSVDAANLAGVLYYLNHEVVSASCPRHYGITRILRLKVTMRPTAAVYNSGPEGSFFMPFVAFDYGACSGAGCSEIWSKWGFNPGCQFVTNPNSGPFRYPHGVWYSFPGWCPSLKNGYKTEACRAAEPGGRCGEPDGQRNCTWNLEPAGELRLDELEGIADYDAFCREGKREYTLETGQGVGFSWWDQADNAARCAARLQAAEDLFAEKYPYLPKYRDPECTLPGWR